VVELATAIPVVVTAGLAVVVDTPAVVTLGMNVVVLDVVKPVMFAKATELKMLKGQKFGSTIGFD
jgi:thiazole synthase ThiGH ThiG subunit